MLGSRFRFDFNRGCGSQRRPRLTSCGRPGGYTSIGLAVNKIFARFGWTLALAALAGIAGCGAPPRDAPAAETGSDNRERVATPAATMKGYNVVIVVLDALRADHLGCYGYARDTSPFIDSLAAHGVVFERAYSNSTFTGESVSAMMSGVPPSANPAGTGWYAMPDPARPTLAATMAAAGYATAFVSDSPVFTISGFEAGFDKFERVNLGWGNSGMGGKVNAAALEFAGAHPDEPFLLHLHYFDPHAPYDPPEAMYKRFATEVFPNPLEVTRDVRPNIAALVASGFGPGDPRFEDMVIRYDAEIAVSDESVQALVKGLEELGLMERTVLIITSDHGEEFLEHGFVEHAWTVYPESIHIPLIVVAPGALAVQRVATPVSLLDLMPTVLELAEIPYVRPDLRGLPLFLRNDGVWTPRTFHQPIISELMVQTRNLARSVIWNDTQYIAAPLWRDPTKCAELSLQQGELRKALQEGTMKPVDPWRASEFEGLYNLQEDEFAQTNRLGQDAVTHRIMEQILDGYRDMCGAGEGAAVPAPAPEFNEEFEEKMNSINYF